MKKQLNIKIIHCPQEYSAAFCKPFVDNLFNHSSIIKNTALRDLNGRNITYARFIQGN